MPLSSPIRRSRSPYARALRYSPLAVLIGGVVVAASCARPVSVSSFDAGEPTSSSSGGTSSGSSGGVGTPSGDDGGGGITVRPEAGSDTCVAANPCHDFPTSPQFEGTAPMNAPTMFGDPSTGAATGGPCVSEPADGSLYPKNWLRPRVLWTASGSETLFEVRVHSDGEANDYVVYTTNTSFSMPKDLWQTIAYAPPLDGGVAAQDGDLIGHDVKVTVRGMSATGGTPATGNSATFTIAPAIADGALIYWTTSSFDNNATNTTLQGFHVGDEGTTTALTANQVAQPVRASPVDGGNLTGDFQQVFCIGCHTATPDGDYVAFTAQWPWPSTLASIQAASPGAVPTWMSKGAVQNLSPDYRGNEFDTWYNPPAVNQIMLGIGTFSAGHYAAGDRMYIATLGTSWNSFSLTDPGVPSGVTSQLAWFNLEWDNATTLAGGLLTTGLPAATPCTTGTYPGIKGSPQPCLPAPASNGGWGIIARNGDSNGAGAPSWSHNVTGTDIIAYASTNVGVKDGRMDCSETSAGQPCASDIYTVPYTSNGSGLGGRGGTAVGLPGASDSAYNEYYPAWSPDDALVAFNRVPAGTSMYNQAKAEVYVVPYGTTAGVTATPVTSGFPPPACTNPLADGVQNTWPKWAPNPLAPNPAGGPAVPTPQVINGKTYYWVTFSSIRSVTAAADPTNGNKRKQQLYVAGIVVDNTTHAIQAFAPIYLWNQDFTVNNLIPAWGEFSIPPGKTLPPFDAGSAM
jgi:hypothetical protein